MPSCQSCNYYWVRTPTRIGEVPSSCMNPKAAKVYIHESCPHWYSDKRQYRNIEGDDWEHRCEEMLDSSSVQWRDGRWVVFYLWGVKVVTRCPYCGIALEKMPEKGGIA